LGAVTIALVLEATRRTVGWVLPATALAFLLYAYLGPAVRPRGARRVAHRGYYLDRLVGTLYMTLEGIFGVPLDVASTYIVLFGSSARCSRRRGRGRFFIDWAMAAMGRLGRGRRAGPRGHPRRFLLGTVSGSGVATTVTLGSVSWPLLRRAGYPPEVGGGILAPPGSAPSVPAHARRGGVPHRRVPGISYLEVLVMATVPTVLYYLSALLMIEGRLAPLGHARGDGVGAPARPPDGRASRLPLPPAGRHHRVHGARRVGLPRGVLGDGARGRAQLLRPESALGPRRLLRALEAGGRGRALGRGDDGGRPGSSSASSR
jgi:hypothetical protein